MLKSKLIKLFCLAIFYIIQLCSQETYWSDNYTQAVKQLRTNPQDSLICYTRAIEGLKNKEHKETLFLYLERADLYRSLNLHQNAIRDYEHVIYTLLPEGCKIADAEGKIPARYITSFCQAVSGRMLSFYDMGNEEHFQEAEVLRKICPQYPQFCELPDGRVLMTNVPTQGVHSETVQLEMIKYGIIEKPEDIQMTPSGYIIKYKKKTCCESCEEGKECEDTKNIKLGLLKRESKKKQGEE